ncbi:MAG TPA: hypothetical protein DCE55_29230 [Planctomycetaceae bacterium]|nr:hypothetical protein [Planctomycetaceae bacterium]|tara:strand:+ start:238 stop:513 length:276 start_codon:yes stop_codon:yes gene_type:complete
METKTAQPPVQLTPRQACDILQISYSTFHKWVKEGVNGKRLRAWQLGGKNGPWRTSLAAIEEFKSYPTEEPTSRVRVDELADLALKNEFGF